MRGRRNGVIKGGTHEKEKNTIHYADDLYDFVNDDPFHTGGGVKRQPLNGLMMQTQQKPP